jgi:hypothetical protein
VAPRRVPGDVNAVWIAAEARGVLINPSHGAAHLIRHRHEVSVGISHRDEIDCDIVRAGCYKHLRWVSRVFGRAAPPGAAVQENSNWGVRLLSPVNI